MVKKKSGRMLNPADAHRKAMRQKEIKKNKAERRRVRTLVMMHKDTSKLEEEIKRYRILDKEKRLDKNGKIKLKDLEDKFSKIVETKKAHGVSITKDKPKDPIFYHPTLNPSGLLPNGDAGSLQSKTSEDSATDDEKSFTNSDESNDDSSDNYENSEEIDDTEKEEEIDEDIPLPPGSPPKQTKETSDNDDDDELPELPPGPPPSKKQFTGPNHFGRPPPPPLPIHGQVYSSHPHNIPMPRPPPFSTNFSPFVPSPFSTKFAHYGPPPFSTKFSYYGPPPSQNQQSKQFSQISSSPNSSLSSFKSNPTTSLSTGKAITLSSPSSTTTATPIIQAEPQVRNLQKELTTLVPATLLRKKAASNKPKVIRPLVNTAPNIDDGLATETTSSSSSASLSSFTIPTKRPSSSVVAANIPILQNQSSTDKQQQILPLPKKSKTRKKVDEYEKFMAEMQDLLQ